MNAVEIEEAVSALAEKPFDPAEFPFEFLTAFGNKETTVKRLRGRSGNTSDVDGGVLQRNHIHLAIAAPGKVGETLDVLRASPKTVSNKARFILATDGVTLEAEDITSGETIAPDYPRFADDFAFFLPLAGISTVKAIKNNPIDIKATGRLNKLYVELLKDNPDWGTPERRHDLNQFMARLIFCFFAEDTGIFIDRLFTNAVRTMSDSQSGNTHEVLEELFRAMDTPTVHEGRFDNRYRKAAGIKSWADGFPYVNGGMFSGKSESPRFSRIARSYLLRAGELDWRQINPDIFGSMIQAVADEDERGELGMHYTSVPNILKVLNPLFLDDLRAELERAGDNFRMLRNLRKRLSRIRVFDPACGSGNFLVIAYKEMRAIEAEIVKRSVDAAISWIPLSNFYGIEIKGFAAEIARLALLIAEFQCDVLYIDQVTARLNVLPLHKTGNIVTGNALRLNWFEVCPPHAGEVVSRGPDFPIGEPDVSELDLAMTSAPTFLCGNPPYVGRRNQTPEQKAEIRQLLGKVVQSSASLDYVFGWIDKASDFVAQTGGQFAFVTTNSVTQGTQIPIYWPHLLAKGIAINFAHRSFRWTNNASHNAGVTCVIVGMGRSRKPKLIFDQDSRYEASHINPYLLASDVDIVEQSSVSIADLPKMNYGNLPGDGNHLTLTGSERERLLTEVPALDPMIRRLYGAQEFIHGLTRFCLWIDDDELPFATSVPFVADRIAKVRQTRRDSKDPSYNKLVERSHQFRDRNIASDHTILVPTVSSETRGYLPVVAMAGPLVTTNQAFALYDAPLWTLSLAASRIHLVWIATVCGKLKTDFRYSNTLGWNTFPIPTLTAQNKADLTRCAVDILLAREAHFPATIAELYDPEAMPENLRAAHERNDETLERIYIGRRFRNDTERLEKLFELYTKMTANGNRKPKPARRSGNGGE